MKKIYWLALILGIIGAWVVMAAVLFFIWIVAPVFFVDFKWLLFGISVVLALVGGMIGVRLAYDKAKKEDEQKKINK